MHLTNRFPLRTWWQQGAQYQVLWRRMVVNDVERVLVLLGASVCHSDCLQPQGNANITAPGSGHNPHTNEVSSGRRRRHKVLSGSLYWIHWHVYTCCSLEIVTFISQLVPLIQAIYSTCMETLVKLHAISLFELFTSWCPIKSGQIPE